MAEESESVRGDTSKRSVDARELIDWTGRRFKIPTGTTLPTTTSTPPASESELFLKEDPINGDKLVVYSPTKGKFVTAFNFGV